MIDVSARKGIEMCGTQLGQTTTRRGAKLHLAVSGLAACGAGSGRIIAATTIPAHKITALGSLCRTCQRILRLRYTAAEAAKVAPKGYRIATWTGWSGQAITIAGPCPTGYSSSQATAWDALIDARIHQTRTAVAARKARAAKAAREAIDSHFCRECGKGLSHFDHQAASAHGYCFDCA